MRSLIIAAALTLVAASVQAAPGSSVVKDWGPGAGQTPPGLQGKARGTPYLGGHDEHIGRSPPSRRSAAPADYSIRDSLGNSRARGSIGPVRDDSRRGLIGGRAGPGPAGKGKRK